MGYAIAIIITIVLSAFFSGMEIAFVSSNKLRLEIEKKQNKFRSQILTIYTQNPGQYIVTMLVGNNVALVLYGIFMTIILEPVFRPFIASDTGMLVIQTIISTLIILVTAEFLPKVIFRINANGLLKFFSIPVFIFYLLFYPVSKSTIFLSNVILRLFFKVPLSGEPQSLVFGKPDLDHLVMEAQGEDDDEEQEDAGIRIFQNALDFSNVKLRECMIPRTELVAMEAGSNTEELIQAFIESGHSKILIFKKSIDNIIGYVNMKDMFGGKKNIKSLVVPLIIAPETMPANKLLQQFVEEQKNIALVVDEFGGTSGIVTIEDILEEIFGEIEDEHDSSEWVEKQISNREFIFSGRLEIDYLNEKYKLDLPKLDDFETLAGLIYYHYESIPKLNHRIILSPFEFKVLKVSEKKIDLVQLRILEPM